MVVGQFYDANFKWHMPICAKRFRAKQNYIPFFGAVTERVSRKNSKAQEHIQMMQRFALDFCLRNALGDGPAFWIFFVQDSRIRVKNMIPVQILTNWFFYWNVIKLFSIACNAYLSIFLIRFHKSKNLVELMRVSLTIFTILIKVNCFILLHSNFKVTHIVN